MSVLFKYKRLVGDYYFVMWTDLRLALEKSALLIVLSIKAICIEDLSLIDFDIKAISLVFANNQAVVSQMTSKASQRSRHNSECRGSYM
jgi:hypothetical protein